MKTFRAARLKTKLPNYEDILYRQQRGYTKKPHSQGEPIILNGLLFTYIELSLRSRNHYPTHSGNTSRLVNLAVVRWLVSYEDENEYE